VKTQRAKEGWLFIENRHAPPPADAAPLFCAPVAECPTFTCSHCNGVVVMNPARTRARAYCPTCDHLICDGCEAIRVASGGACRTFAQLIDDAHERVVKGLPALETIPCR
jgi:hypothetical protein